MLQLNSSLLCLTLTLCQVLKEELDEWFVGHKTHQVVTRDHVPDHFQAYIDQLVANRAFQVRQVRIIEATLQADLLKQSIELLNILTRLGEQNPALMNPWEGEQALSEHSRGLLKQSFVLEDGLSRLLLGLLETQIEC